MKWIRLSVHIGADPSMLALADELRITRMAAVGGCALIFSALPEQARDGNVAAVPDSAIELWAGWEGKRGLFARAFRAHLCTPEGVVSGWEKHNGAAIRKADTDAKRQAEYRDKLKMSRATARDVTPIITRDTARDVTGRDELLNYTSSSSREKQSFPHAQSGNGEAKERASAPDYITTAIPECYRPSMLTLRGLARHPESFDGELRMILAGAHGPSGRAIPGAVLGRAVHEMAANSAVFNVALLRGYLRRLAAEANAPESIAADIGRPLTIGERSFLTGLRALDAAP